jgi:hypothetical protein
MEDSPGYGQLIGSRSVKRKVNDYFSGSEPWSPKNYDPLRFFAESTGGECQNNNRYYSGAPIAILRQHSSSEHSLYKADWQVMPWIGPVSRIFSHSSQQIAPSYIG